MCFDACFFWNQYVIMFIVSACLAAGGCFECPLFLWQLIVVGDVIIVIDPAAVAIIDGNPTCLVVSIPGLAGSCST